LDAGWWLTYPSEKYEFVSWDYYTQYMEKEMFQTTNQDVCLRFQVLLALFSAAVRLGIFRWTATPSIPVRWAGPELGSYDDRATELHGFC